MPFIKKIPSTHYDENCKTEVFDIPKGLEPTISQEEQDKLINKNNPKPFDL